jgi:vacuolar-type H+-ATPase subunit I/STV1
MTTQIKAIRNPASAIFGTLLFLVGLVLSLYDQGSGYQSGHFYSHFFPYQTVGIIMILIGIVFVGLGLFYSPRISPPPPEPPQHP